VDRDDGVASDIPLVEEWRGRVGSSGCVDLREHANTFPELMEAIAPATYTVVPRSGEVTTDADG
jgi:hypothetical protein